MKIEEIYNHYENNWCEVMRELKVGSTTLQNWRKKGHIPIKSQMIIEDRSDGLFKARLEDASL